jgi:hypothetical protein
MNALLLFVLLAVKPDFENRIRPDCDIVGAPAAGAPQQSALAVQPFDVAGAIARSINQGKQAAAANLNVKEKLRVRKGLLSGLLSKKKP